MTPIIELVRQRNVERHSFTKNTREKSLSAMTDIKISSWPNTTVQTTSLICLVEGECKVFPVTVATNREISNLKEQVHATGNSAQDLVLFKVSVHRQQLHCRSHSVRSIYLSMRILVALLDSSQSPEARKEFKS